MAITNHSLYLPPDYKINDQRSSEVDGPAFWADSNSFDTWQVPVYRLAAEMVERRNLCTVVDIGCGTGTKVYQQLGDMVRLIGFDQPSGIDIARRRHPDAEWLPGDLTERSMWRQVAALAPELILCVDVIEHLDDPIALLTNIHQVLGRSSSLLISTPDRSRLELGPPLGPPYNPRHIREWTAEEFQQLLVANGFTIVGSWHIFPRVYRPTAREIVRGMYRLSKGRHPLDNKRSMAFEVRVAPR